MWGSNSQQGDQESRTPLHGLSQPGAPEKEFFNLIKNIFNKPIANIPFLSEIL